MGGRSEACIGDRSEAGMDRRSEACIGGRSGACTGVRSEARIVECVDGGWCVRGRGGWAGFSEVFDGASRLTKNSTLS